MIKREVIIKGIKYTIRAKSLEILDQSIKDLRKFHRKTKDKDAI